MPGQDTNPADLSSDINVELDNSWENGRPSSSPTTVNRESDAHQETSASNTTNDNSFQLCQNRQLEDSSDWSRRLPSTSAPSSSRQSLTHDDPGPATSTSNSTFRNYIYGGSSDSGSESDDAQVNCPVCFVSLLNREVATPDTCQHYFCCPCLKQWSTTVTTCPVDRRKFKLILVRNNIGGQVIRVDPVEPVSVRSFGDGDDDYDDPTYCQVCHQSDREDRMLLCDYCDSGFHLECLNPPLDEVPDGDWFCSRCQLLDTRNTEQSQGRVTWVRVPTFPVGLGGRSVQCVRVPPVNRQVEEIISVSSDDESEVEIVTRSGRRIRRPSVSSNSDSARPQRKTLLIREPVEPSIVRKKVSRRIPSLRGEGSFSHTQRRRQQNTSESSRQTVEDSDEDGDVRTARRSRRSRLAENLGLVPCRRSYSSSTTNASAPASCLNRQRVSAGIPTLHLFGSDSLDYFSDGSDGETGNEGGGGGSRGGGSRVLCHRSRSSPTTARRLAARKLSQSLMGNASRPRVNLNPRPSTSRDTTSSSHHNLLDSIMESQGLWHSRNTTMSLARDGTITIEKAPEVERPSEAMPSSNNGPRSSTVTEPSDRYRDRIQNDSNPQEFSSPLFTRRDTIGVAPVTNRISNIFTSRAGSSRSFNSARQQTNVNRFPWESHTSNRISLTDNQTRVSQVPLYPGNSNNSRSPGSSGSYHNNDSQYERSSTSSYQYSGHTYSSTRQSGFDSERGHLGYSGYLGPENSSTSSDLPNSGRFSLLPPYTVRRTQPHPSTSLSTSRADDRQLEESDFLDDPDVSSGKSSNERDSKKNTYRKVTEDDDLDIYSDIEVSSTGEQNCASEHEDNERSFDVLPPPPEPSALLIGLGVQDSSDSETNDSLVIDIRPNPDDHIPKDNATKSPDESEKYDPAVPCDDSDDDEPVVSQNKQKEDIPLPPCPPSLEKIDVSTSNASYLQSPTYGELSKQCSVHVTEAVTEAVKEAISSTLQSSSASINKALASGDEDDDEGECPNFSIYSADSMDIARKATEIPEENSDALDKSDTATTEQVKVDVEKCETKTDILEVPVELGSDQNNQESRDNDEQMEETGSISEMRQEPLENNDDVIEQLSKNLHCSSRSSSSCSSSSSSCCSSSSSSSGSSSSSSDDGSSISQNTSCEEPNKDATSEEKDVKTVSVEQTGDQTSNVNDVKSVVSGASENCEKSAIGDENGAKDHEIVELDESVEKENLVVGRASAVPVVSSDNAIGTQNKTALSLDNTASSLNSSLPAATPAGLEGLETETISETEEAINFDDDMSHDETSLLSEEDGEISPRKKKKKKATDEVKDSTKVDISVSVEKPVLEKDLSPDETVDYEEGEIIDERPTPSDVAQKDKILDKDKRHGSNEIRSADEAEMSESSVHIGTEGEKKKKKKKSSDRDRAELSVNDDDAGKGKGGTLDDSISWKKPSKGTKERNYRDSKSVKPTEKGKDGSRKENEDKELPKKDKKKKEKRKDMERYDVRKIVSDKKRKRKDEFGRDLSRDRSYSRSRSRSKSRGKSRDRSTSLSRSKTNRTKGRSSPGRSRHRSRSRSRSRSYRSRSRSKNKSLSKLKDRSRKSRSKERQRKSSRDRSRSRNRRSRSRSGSRLRNRSRSRSIHKSREGKDRSRAAVRQKRPPKNRRSWSRTWTPSWSRSRSRSRSVSGSSYSRSPSPSARRYNRSYSRSFSRSWSRERHERVPLMEKKTNTVSKPPKNLTVIVNNSKEDSERQRKKEKKKKDSRKSKDQSGAEKRKKRKERSPLPSKEVFTSGDNILVSVNFNKSNKGPGAKDAAVAAAAAVTSASICALPKDSSKRKQRDDAFDVARETPKKTRKDKSGKEKTSKGLNSNAANSDKTQNRRSKKATKADKRLAALLRQKPVAIIDLDQSPFREQTPSPRDLIVLSDSDETQRDKETEMEDGIMARMMHQEILSPQNSLKMSATARTPESQSPVMSSVGNYLNTSTGPKTPPEPQIKFSIAAKPQLRSISNPLREEDDDLMAEDTVLDESDRQMHEDLDRDIMHKGPNTPPEPRGPTTPCSPPISPDAYDPFDPTKSGTPSPVREEVNIDELQSPSGTPCEEVMQHPVGVTDSPIQSDLDDNAKKTLEISSEIPLLQSSDNLRDDVTHSPDRSKSITMIETMLGKSPSNIDESVAGASQHQLQVEVSPSEPGEKSSSLSVTMIVPINSDITPLSPEIKIIPMTVQQQKLLKQNIVQQQPVTSTPTHCSTPSNYATLPTSIASTPISPLTSTPVSRSNVFSTPVTITVPQLSSHHLVSPVVSQQRAVGIKTVPEKVTSISYVKNVPQRTTGQQNGDQKEQIQDISTEVVDMDLDSPYSPGSSEGDDLFEPPSEIVKPTASYPPMNTRSSQTPQKNVRQSLPALGNTPNKPPDKFDALFGMSPARNKGSAKMGKFKTHHSRSGKMKGKLGKGSKKEIQIKMDEDQLQILDDLPSSAVELQVKDKFLKKLNRQERVVEEVKLSLKPYYTSKKINKEEYKEILRRSVPKICHNRSGEINPKKISALVDAYVLKYRYLKKKQVSSQRKQAKPPRFDIDSSHTSGH